MDAEYRIANRDVPLLPGQDLATMAKKVLEYFAEHHTEIGWSGAARLAYQGLCTVYNANCAVARDSGSVTEAARLGAGPWHLAMLAGALVVFEIAVGVYDGTEQKAARTVKVEEEHVSRAYAWLQVLHALRREWSSQPADADALATQQALDAATRAAQASMHAGASLPEFGEWCPTQTQAAAATGSEAGLPAPAIAALVDIEVDHPGGDWPEAREAPNTPAAAGPTQASRGSAPDPRNVRCLAPGDPEVPSMEVGYGENGAQVQRPDEGHVILKDREVMKKTLLRGEAICFGSDVCGSISAALPRVDGAKRRRSSLALRHWDSVMKAALEQYRVGKFVSALDSERQDRPRQSYIQIELPPASDEAMQRLYHNRMMQMCQLALATFSHSVAERGERVGRRRRSAPVPAPPAPGADLQEAAPAAGQGPVAVDLGE